MPGRWLIDLDAPAGSDQLEAGLVTAGQRVWHRGQFHTVAISARDPQDRRTMRIELDGDKVGITCDEMHVYTVEARAAC